MLGSVMMTTDSIGHASNRYDYDAYGTAYTGSFNGRNKIGYNGKQYDSGTGWYNVSVNSSLNYSTHSPRILKGVISMFQGSSLFQSSVL